MDVRTNHRELQIESKRTRASCIRLMDSAEAKAVNFVRSSTRTRDQLTILVKHLVVLGDGDEEDDGGDVLETVDPLFTLGALSSNVEHAVLELSNLEVGLGDTSRLDTGAENVCSGKGQLLSLRR